MTRAKENVNQVFDSETLLRAWQLVKVLLTQYSYKSGDIVVEAVDEWLTYSKPSRAYNKPRERRKETLEGLLLLQYLLYDLVTGYERKEEEEDIDGRLQLHENTMILRFIKHILFLTLESVFYLTAGIYMILHSYTSTDANCLYETITQGKFKDWDKFRKEKLKLLDKLKKRFGRLIEYDSTNKKGKWLIGREDQLGKVQFVNKSLEILFNPWGSKHVLLGDSFESPKIKQPISGLLNRVFGRTVYVEKLAIEESAPGSALHVSRSHTAICPECSTKLINALALPGRDQKLHLPRFFHSRKGEDDNNSPNDLDNLPNLSPRRNCLT